MSQDTIVLDSDVEAAASSLSNLKRVKLVRSERIDPNDVHVKEYLANRDYKVYQIKQRILELYKEINGLRKRIKELCNE